MPRLAGIIDRDPRRPVERPAPNAGYIAPTAPPVADMPSGWVGPVTKGGGVAQKPVHGESVSPVNDLGRRLDRIERDVLELRQDVHALMSLVRTAIARAFGLDPG